MLDILVLDGDLLQFDPMFGNRQVSVPPTQIHSTTECFVGGRPICVKGDEMELEIMAPYNAPPFVGGMGRITILLMPNQFVATVLCALPVLVKGNKFQALFTPTKPAQDPQQVPEPPAPTQGFGIFLTTQIAVRAG